MALPISAVCGPVPPAEALEEVEPVLVFVDGERFLSTFPIFLSIAFDTGSTLWIAFRIFLKSPIVVISRASRHIV